MFRLSGCVASRDYVSSISSILSEGARVWIPGVTMFVFPVGPVGWRSLASGFWGILTSFENCNGVGLCSPSGGKYKGSTSKLPLDCFSSVLRLSKLARLSSVPVSEWRVGGLTWGLMWCVVLVADSGPKGAPRPTASVPKVLLRSAYVVSFGALLGPAFRRPLSIFLSIVPTSSTFATLGSAEVGIQIPIAL